MHLRHRLQARPGSGERSGDGGESARERAQAISRRRELPRRDVVDGTTGIGDHRIPRVLAQFVQLEGEQLEGVPEKTRVHAVLRAEHVRIETGQALQIPADYPSPALERLRAHVGQLSVVAMVAERRRPVGTVLERVLERALREPPEGVINWRSVVDFDWRTLSFHPFPGPPESHSKLTRETKSPASRTGSFAPASDQYELPPVPRKSRLLERQPADSLPTSSSCRGFSHQS